MKESIAFYVDILDFKLIGIWPENDGPSFCILTRENEEIHLSTHSGDGAYGNVVSILVNDIDTLITKFIGRGLDTASKKESPVHQGPVHQTWGTTEFYVDDPNGNTVRFISR